MCRANLLDNPQSAYLRSYAMMSCPTHHIEYTGMFEQRQILTILCLVLDVVMASMQEVDEESASSCAVMVL